MVRPTCLIPSLVLPLSLTLSLAMAPATPARAEAPMTRAELGRSETATETETIVSELRMMPGAYLRLHTHPGDEHVYVVKGGPMTTRDGRTIAFEPGGYLFFPRGQLHGGLTAAGEGEVVVMTVHVVDKGQPVYDYAE